MVLYLDTNWFLEDLLDGFNFPSQPAQHAFSVWSSLLRGVSLASRISKNSIRNSLNNCCLRVNSNLSAAAGVGLNKKSLIEDSEEGGFVPRDAESQRILKIFLKFLAQPTIQNSLLSLRQRLKSCPTTTLSKSLNLSVTIESVKNLDLTRLQRTSRKQEFNETLKAAPMSQHCYISRLPGF
ncbi:hypothetical protein N7535_001699 [Penicillium sp. DV-2018c]|nr:hypothetical protein N7535_001699 [Penicillium sp. DV-2018c]